MAVDGVMPVPLRYISLVSLLVVVFLILHMVAALRQHFRRIERLRGVMVGAKIADQGIELLITERGPSGVQERQVVGERVDPIELR